MLFNIYLFKMFTFQHVRTDILKRMPVFVKGAPRERTTKGTTTLVTMTIRRSVGPVQKAVPPKNPEQRATVSAVSSGELYMADYILNEKYKSVNIKPCRLNE